MQKQVHGGDIYSHPCRIDFSSNMNPLGMPESVRKAALEGVLLSEHYPDVHCRALREAIGRREEVPFDWVICGNGAAELIFALCWAKKPKKALLTAPSFAEYEQALASTGCEITFYECREEAGFALQEDFLDALKEDLDLVFLCSPNNPTGVLIPPALLKGIVSRCRKRGIFLVMDECFQPFLEQGEEESLKGKLGENNGIFVLRAFTKLYAMAGLRLGYGICSDTKFLNKLRGVLQPWNVSLPAQMAGIAAAEELTFARKSRELIAAERAFLQQGLRGLGLKTYDSKANYVFFKGPADLFERCLKEGILIRDCSSYRGLGEGYFRAAVRLREENRELLGILKEAVRR